VVVSGTDVVRPSGQRKDPSDAAPTFGPSTRLDLEAELGFVVGVGTPLGTPIPIDACAEHVFGAVLVNDWSARDLQAWEYVPLGPHLGKSFATSVSPWVVPLLALEAARIPLPGQDDPRPLPYLRASAPWGLDVDLAVEWNGEVVSRPPYRAMYWSPAQMLAHMTVNGASARTGDLVRLRHRLRSGEEPVRLPHRAHPRRPGTDHRQRRASDVSARRRHRRPDRHRTGRGRRPHRLRGGTRPGDLA